MKNDEIWWEKTVEYKFVIEAERHKGLNFAAPLSGVQERAGDGVFSSDSKIILVEFKRGLADLKTEQDKFICFESAREEMRGKDTHHYLVYGSKAQEAGSDLCLNAKHYFSRKSVDSAMSILDSGLDSEDFMAYLDGLIRLKKVDKRSTGTVGPESVASAVGVSASGVSAVSLSEYVRIAMPTLYKRLEPTQRRRNNLTLG
ncbi:hypothetical protein FH712_10010 [Marinobacter nauticus]|uniref:hypothetical protein n=1 Tax=Marinobacter nauticus TaxID=2743 RepID=UPI00112F870D|nr:hypothetical protein [Marinobacter nauticus]TPW23421.1 hypothetical protein FH712_10010 [Marinobacter nauticus]